MPIKWYDGAAFQRGIVKAFDGSAWNRYPVKVWDGSQWILVSYLEDWNNGTGSWTDPVGTTTNNPVTDDVSENLSAVHGFTSTSSSGFASSGNPNITISAGDGIIRYYTRSGGAAAGSDEDQFSFARQSSNVSNRYRFTLFTGQNGAYFHKYTDGGATQTTLFATSSGITIDGEEWALVEIRWDADGYLEARVKNVTTGEGPWTIGSTTDTTYSSGSVAIGTYNGSNASGTDMDGLQIVDSFTI